MSLIKVDEQDVILANKNEVWKEYFGNYRKE
jgi:hypothetical protein